MSVAEGKFQLEVVTPTRRLIKEMVDEVTAPGVEGEFGVLVGHIPFVTELGLGRLTYRTGSTLHVLAVRKGFAEATQEKVTILAEEAEFAKDINVAQEEAQLAEAEAALKTYSEESKEYLEAQARLERSMNRISVVKGH